MVRKKLLTVIIGIVIITSLVGTSVAMDGRNPFKVIWEAIYGLETRVKDVEEVLNETSPIVELLWNASSEEPVYEEGSEEPVDWITVYHYEYGISDRWNVLKIQTDPFNEKMNSTLNGTLRYNVSYGWANPFETETLGYEKLVVMQVKEEELSEADIEEVRLLILQYLV